MMVNMFWFCLSCVVCGAVEMHYFILTEAFMISFDPCISMRLKKQNISLYNAA